MPIMCVLQYYVLHYGMAPCNGIQCPLLCNMILDNTQHLQNAILCNMHISLVPPAGGVQAGHDDEVVHPVTNVEQPKHCREIGIKNAQSCFFLGMGKINQFYHLVFSLPTDIMMQLWFCYLIKVKFPSLFF